MLPQTIDFGRAIGGEYAEASRREWLVTNGIGGYAAGTIAGSLTRHYHGLLIAALEPPLGRTLMLVKLDETVTYDGRMYPLYTNRMEDGSVEPLGFQRIERFYLDGTTPVWVYAIADALLEKRIWMEQGANTTYVRYTLLRGTLPLSLTVDALSNDRDHHDSTEAADWDTQVTPVAQGLRIAAREGAVPLYLHSDRAEAMPETAWVGGFYKSVEAYRGQPVLDDHLKVGAFTVTLTAGESVVFVASTEDTASLDGDAAWQRRVDYEAHLIGISGLQDEAPEMRQLVLAADQFIVKRGEGHTVLAGYPWFSDWGRDTMIALPGLTLAVGRPEVAASILRTFARFIDQGMLPNRFPDAGEVPEYNTVDATLWFFEGIRAYYAATGDDTLMRELFPALTGIIDWHERGTRYNIHMDPDDGLLVAGTADVQLTWMDVKIGDEVVTPRTGKAVEINALWYNALRCMFDFANLVGDDSSRYRQMADRVQVAYGRFWTADQGYLYDVIDGPDGDDASLRPNQVIAASLHYTPLTPDQRLAAVDVCARHLLTSHGLRSLNEDDVQYVGVYSGDYVQRDRAYHQGTVWGWLIGPFVAAHLRVYDDRSAARDYLRPLLQHLRDHGLGSISEIFDGDSPFRPRGCFAQAWSVAEVLRVWRITDPAASEE